MTSQVRILVNFSKIIFPKIEFPKIEFPIGKFPKSQIWKEVRQRDWTIVHEKEL